MLIGETWRMPWRINTCAHSRHLPAAKVRAFIDFVIEILDVEAA
jgi:hypothetical protein